MFPTSEWWPLTRISAACFPLVLSAGYIRLRVVVLKDQKNKKLHASSAQVACEAAGAIKTVASLGREEDCCRQYSALLEEPLRHSDRSGMLSNVVYALSQSMSFWVIALVFWYGSQLVSRLELPMFNFFVALMVSELITNESQSFTDSHLIRVLPLAPSKLETSSLSFPMCRPPVVPPSTSLSSWILSPILMLARMRVSSPRRLSGAFVSRTSTSATPLVLVPVSSVDFPSLSSLVPLSPSSGHPAQENRPPFSLWRDSMILWSETFT